jgi:hypothetical protein
MIKKVCEDKRPMKNKAYEEKRPVKKEPTQVK